MKKKPKAKPTIKPAVPKVLYILLPLVATAIFFSPVLGFDILNWDDKGYLMENPLLKDFSIAKLFTLFWMGNYHPLTMLLYTIGFKLVGSHGFLFHLVNLMLHLVNVYLVFRITEKLVKNNLFVAALTALLFGIHPMHIESVAWIAELKDVLYATFFLLSLNTYLLYLKKGGTGRYLAALLFFLLSLLSKGQAVVLTPVIILADILWKRKFNLTVIAEKIPFLALSVVFGLVALKAQQSVSALSYGMVNDSENYLYGFYNYISYIQKAIYPGVLSGVHPYVSTSHALLYTCTILFFLFIGGSYWLYRKTGLLTLFGLSFFVVTISIVVKFIPVGEALLGERYSYIPYIGLFLLIAMFFSWLLQKPKYKTAGIAALSVYLLILIIPGFMYLLTYKNSETYWLNTIKAYPAYYRAHYVLALHYNDTGQSEKAVDHNTQAINLLEPGFPKEMANLYYNRASIYVNKLSDFSRAADDYRQVLKYDSTMKEPDSTMKNACFFLGYCYSKMDRLGESYPFLKHYVALDSTNAKAYYFLALANSGLNQYQDAYDNLGKAIRLDPGFSDAYLQRSIVCIDYLARPKDALNDLMLLVNQRYMLNIVYFNLANCNFHLGLNSEVIKYCDLAIGLQADKGTALFLKALTYEKMHQYRDAFTCGQAARDAGYRVDDNLLRKWKSAAG